MKNFCKLRQVQFLWLISLVSGLVLSISACGSRKTIEHHEGIRFVNISTQMRDVVTADLQSITTDPITQTPELTQLLGGSVKHFLDDNIHYLTGPAFSEAGRIATVETDWKYPNPGVLPAIGAYHRNMSNYYVLAENKGSAIYVGGKTSHNLLSVQLDEIGEVLVDSPKVGIIQLHNGFFRQTGNPDVDRYLRITTLIHEAAHSLGNGQSLAQLHRRCGGESNIFYRDREACDHTNNGAYAFGAAYLRSVLKTKKKILPDTTLGALQMELLDNLDRLPELPQWERNRYSKRLRKNQIRLDENRVNKNASMDAKMGTMRRQRNLTPDWNHTPERAK